MPLPSRSWRCIWTPIPEDTEALELYRQYQQLYQKVSQAYEREKRPLNHAAPGRGDTYAWLDDPWPWEYAANKGE